MGGRASRRSAAVLALIAVAAGCGGGDDATPASPEQVVRAWSAALNTDDNAAAGRLFAPGALVVQGGAVYELRGPADAARWTASLPCSGHIVEVTLVQETVTAVFILGNRARSRCDAPPGTRAAARFTVRSGKIVGWEQVPVPGEAEGLET